MTDPRRERVLPHDPSPLTGTDAAILAMGRYVLDRACQYRESTGSHDALVKVAAAILKGEATEAWEHGELDDKDLVEWADRIRRVARPSSSTEKP